MVAINAGPGQVETLSKEQAALKADIARRTDEISAAREKLAAAVKESDELQARLTPQLLADLERSVQSLDDQVKGLEQEVAEAEKTTRNTKSSLSLEAKLKRDENRFKELLTRNRDLTMGLKNLQRSMVSMDKKKALLEKELDQVKQY
ncbi:MAG: hypothetical protein HQL20_09255 [Candidatus Omnitrophica bacterium]|nr:hypothetical protein [Candidatus Omnitrophota bacterium]